MNVLVKTGAKPAHRVLIAGFGQKSDPAAGSASRYIEAAPDGIRFWGGAIELKTNSPLDLGRWQMLTVTYDGETLAIYKDGEPIGKERAGFASDAEGVVSAGPAGPWDQTSRFQGSIRDFTIRRGNMSQDEVKKFYDENKPSQ